jgi:hypothetical protein
MIFQVTVFNNGKFAEQKIVAKSDRRGKECHLYLPV